MAEFGAGDAPALLADFGVDFTIGAETTKGLVDHVGGRVLDEAGEMVAGEGVLTVGTIVKCSLTGAVQGAPVTVDGVAMVISAVLPFDDGLYQHLVLRSA